MYGSGDEVMMQSSVKALRCKGPPERGVAPNLNPGVIIADGESKDIGEMSELAKLGEKPSLV